MLRDVRDDEHTDIMRSIAAKQSRNVRIWDVGVSPLYERKRSVKKIALYIILIILAMSIHSSVWAADPVKVIVDGKEIVFDDAPAYLDSSGRTKAPSRFIGEALGADVGWDEQSGRVSFYRVSSDSKRIYVEFQIGSFGYYIGKDKGKRDERYAMDTQTVIENNRTYIPIRYVAEALGANVEWDSVAKTVTITSEQRIVNGFVIPDSYTETVYETDDGDIKAVLFTIYFMSNLETRLEKTLEIVSQRLGRESIDRVRGWVMANRVHEAKDENDHLRETFLDAESGQYVRVTRLAAAVKTDGDIRIIVYNKGDIPS